jgi:hypothetical protein
MSSILLILIGVVGGLSTLGMINAFWYIRNKINK